MAISKPSDDNAAIVVAQLDDMRWMSFRWYHRAGPNVGGTGRRQLFELCCLMRRLYRALDHTGSCQCYGRHLDSADFVRLLEGEVYPGAILRPFRNDQWWIDFAELAEVRVEGETSHVIALREAICIAQDVLAEFQDGAESGGWMQETLQAAGFPAKAELGARRYRLDAGLR